MIDLEKSFQLHELNHPYKNNRLSFQAFVSDSKKSDRGSCRCALTQHAHDR